MLKILCFSELKGNIYLELYIYINKTIINFTNKGYRGIRKHIFLILSLDIIKNPELKHITKFH